MTDTEKIKLITKMLDDCWGSSGGDEDGEFLLGVMTCIDVVARFGGANDDK